MESAHHFSSNPTAQESLRFHLSLGVLCSFCNTICLRSMRRRSTIMYKSPSIVFSARETSGGSRRQISLRSCAQCSVTAQTQTSTKRAGREGSQKGEAEWPEMMKSSQPVEIHVNSCHHDSRRTDNVGKDFRRRKKSKILRISARSSVMSSHRKTCQPIECPRNSQSTDNLSEKTSPKR